MRKIVYDWRWFIAGLSLLPVLWLWTMASELMSMSSDLAVGVGFALFGGVVGVFYLFLKWLFDNSTKEKEDAKQSTGTP